MFIQSTADCHILGIHCNIRSQELFETAGCVELSYEYAAAFSRYTIITHLCSHASPPVHTKCDDVTHLFLETTCSLLLLRVIKLKLSNLLIGLWSKIMYTVSLLLHFSYTQNFETQHKSIILFPIILKF